MRDPLEPMSRRGRSRRTMFLRIWRMPDDAGAPREALVVTSRPVGPPTCLAVVLPVATPRECLDLKARLAAPEGA